MKEKIETIPVNEAFRSEDECPFCYLQRQAEQRAIRYIAGPGASYMEPLIRGKTDNRGFCKVHMKKLFDYGNSLGNALILQTYLVGLRKELAQQLADFSAPPKKALFGNKPAAESTLVRWEKDREESCFLCESIEERMERYFATFFHLIKEPEFRAMVEGGKGFCMCHFARLMDTAAEQLPNSQYDWFYKTIPDLMQKNLDRVQEDLDWFVQKFDYRNTNASWKNSRDAVSRTMQKIQGIYPADPPFKEK